MPTTLPTAKQLREARQGTSPFRYSAETSRAGDVITIEQDRARRSGGLGESDFRFLIEKFGAATATIEINLTGEEWHAYDPIAAADVLDKVHRIQGPFNAIRFTQGGSGNLHLHLCSLWTLNLSGSD